MDTDPGDGDGILDDCTGMTVDATDDGGNSGSHPPRCRSARPDGFADFYVLDPAWGNIFQIGNYNKSNYDGITPRVRSPPIQELADGSLLHLVEGDRATPRTSTSALGDDRSTLQDEKGYLSFDRRHSVKLNATCLTPWGFRLGGTAQWESGLPYSIL